MSMVSSKTIETAGVRRPDLSKCREVFEKYSRFYKAEDIIEILEKISNNVDTVKLFLEIVEFKTGGRDLAGIIGKVLTFPVVPAYEIQRKTVDIYDMMLARVTDEKEYLIEETLKKATENGLIMLVIRVLEDTRATKDLLECVKSYEMKHSKEEPVYEARMDKVFRKQVRITDGNVREVIKNAMEERPLSDAEGFFKDSVGRGYEPIPVQEVIREAELSEYIHDEREIMMLEDLMCEDPAWDRFYEKDLDADTLLRMATEEYNWDDGTVIPYVIVKQKNCDRDLAKAIFDHANGADILAIEEPRPWDREWIEFFKALKYQIENS